MNKFMFIMYISGLLAETNRRALAASIRGHPNVVYGLTMRKDALQDVLTAVEHGEFDEENCE